MLRGSLSALHGFRSIIARGSDLCEMECYVHVLRMSLQVIFMVCMLRQCVCMMIESLRTCLPAGGGLLHDKSKQQATTTNKQRGSVCRFSGRLTAGSCLTHGLKHLSEMGLYPSDFDEIGWDMLRGRCHGPEAWKGETNIVFYRCSQWVSSCRLVCQPICSRAHIVCMGISKCALLCLGMLEHEKIVSGKRTENMILLKTLMPGHGKTTTNTLAENEINT
jgi:hypothetical protein